MNRKSTEQRFWEKVERTTGCWVWHGEVSWQGRARFWDGEHHINAARYSYRLAHGEFPDDLNVCHTCDNPLCVNPAHLFLGTQKDNVDDCWSKGRAKTIFPRFGEAHPCAKLTAVQVQSIRSRLSESPTSLAHEFGVTAPTICNIKAGRIWKQL